MCRPDTHRRRRARLVAPSLATISAISSPYWEGEETTVTAALFLAADRSMEGPAWMGANIVYIANRTRVQKEWKVRHNFHVHQPHSGPAHRPNRAAPHSPPMSMFSMHVSKSPPLATVASKAYKLTTTRSMGVMPCVSMSVSCVGFPRTPSRPPWICGEGGMCDSGNYIHVM